MLLALRGSGQGVYVGLAEDRFIVASEPYGVVEETRHYVRLDGETRRAAGRASTPSRAGTLDGIARLAYDGTALPVADGRRRRRAEVTTRDIDRGECPHFLLKEITESPDSFAKTLRGKIVETRRAAARRRRRRGPCRRRSPSGSPTGRSAACPVIGQGTAAVAGQRRWPTMLDELAGGERSTSTRSPPPSCPGFGLRLDMSDTLAVAVSQSGTTTDTNRTVDLLAGRGAAVLAIVNRRSSDLTDKADGVLYTSDGRDVEMSVASTKAFYAQVAAGMLLACAITEAAGIGTAGRRHELLTALRTLPDAMRDRARPPRRSSPTPPAASHRPSATGRSSATAPTRSPPRRCGSSSASSATSRSPATSPRTRSTSTCRPSR